MPASRSKLHKIGTIARGLLSHAPTVKAGVNDAYNRLMLLDSPIKTVDARAFVGEQASVALEDFFSVDGNVTLEEVVVICALVRQAQPANVVEIGTFDGNTTLQLAINTAPDATIHTLDLPVGADYPIEVDKHDIKYIGSDKRIKRRFLDTRFEKKVVQHYGNSLTYDFSTFADKLLPDFIFIDAGHSYECVRNDSEKSLAVLAPSGMIIWQDYSTGWPGVYNYLIELAKTLPLVHIAGTSLVIYRK